MLSNEDLTRLMQPQQPPCLSLYMRTIKAGDQVQKNPIRFKNLLREAEEKLVAAGQRSPDARDLLGPVYRLLEDEVFWQHQEHGLALFLASGLFEIHRLPIRFDEIVQVGASFFLRPLLPMLTGDGEFYILAQRQDEVRLLKGTRYNVQEVELEGVPDSLASALRFGEWDDSGKQVSRHAVQSRTPRRPSAPTIFFRTGSGDDEERNKKDILRYFHKVDDGLREYLGMDGPPLVLAGVEYVLPLFHEASSYKNLEKEGIPGNPEGLSAEELHQRAWEILEPHFQQDQKEAFDVYMRLAGKDTSRAADRITDIVPAAYYGRVGQLFLSQGAHAWGTFDPQTGQTTLTEEGEPGSQELMDFAAVQTFMNRGVVYAVLPGDVPGGKDWAAILRY